MISEILPKHAKPAFFVLAPCGKNPFSKIIILAVGNFSRYARATCKPTMPLPTMV
jgi:hypothetical protein